MTRKATAPLVQIIQVLKQRCLYHSASWLSKVLITKPSMPLDWASDSFDPDNLLLNLDSPLQIHLALLQSHIDLREYEKVDDVFLGNENLQQLENLHPSLAFLKFWAEFMRVERDAFQSELRLSSSLESSSSSSSVGKQSQNGNKGASANNAYFDRLIQLKSDIIQRRQNSDPFNLYLLGVVSARLKNEKQAIDHLIQSIEKFPFNWSAFKELLLLKLSPETIGRLSKSVGSSPCFMFFMVHYAMEHSHPADEILHHIQNIKKYFGNIPEVNVLYALHHYHMREFPSALNHFYQFYHNNPNSMEFIDIYSNILFLCGDAAQLSLLAQKCAKIDRFRPETFLVIANYYALKGVHEKAVIYFRRALRLNRSYLPAWTLLGHEYLELHNYKAAIEAYQTAIDIDKNDYRAWFGLGQVYEIMELFPYAIHHYNKAVVLRPKDKRIWSALADAYNKFGSVQEGLLCMVKSLGDNLPPHLKQIIRTEDHSLFVTSNSKSAMRGSDMDLVGAVSNAESDTQDELNQAVSMWFRIGTMYLKTLNNPKKALIWYLDAIEMGSLERNDEYCSAVLFCAEKLRATSPNRIAVLENALKSISLSAVGSDRERAKYFLTLIDSAKETPRMSSTSAPSSKQFHLHRRP